MRHQGARALGFHFWEAPRAANFRDKEQNSDCQDRKEGGRRGTLWFNAEFQSCRMKTLGLAAQLWTTEL